MNHPDLDLPAARTRIAPFVHRTPVIASTTFNGLAGAKVFFKLENLQRIAAFKARGAHNAVFSLGEEEARRGVVTHSSGNHAAALSLAAANRGIVAHIVMPSNAPAAKVASVKRLGGKITFCEPTLAAREGAAARIQQETGAVLIHPYNDPRIIAGQGTAAMELLASVTDLDAIIVPVGGGGLLSGTALAAQLLAPRVKVYGAEPLIADDAAQSLRTKRLIPLPAPTNTVADGLRTSLGDVTFPLIRDYVEDIATVPEEAIVAAMRLSWEVLKQVIEPSAAVPVAALLSRTLPLEGKRVGVILSGGNVDLDRLPWQTLT